MEINISPLKLYRVAKGLSQEELSVLVDRTQQWLSLVEQGRILPQSDQARQLAKILETDKETLFP